GFSSQTVQFTRIRHWQRLQQNRIHQRKNRSGRANAQRQRHDRCAGERWSHSQSSQRVAQILNYVLNPSDMACVAAFLFGLLDTAQVESCAAVCLFLRHPLRDVFLGFSFEVIAQLVIHFLVRLRPAKQRPQPQGNRVQPMLRSHTPALLHSYLRATMGSTREARRDGIKQASSATIVTRKATVPIVRGSVGLTLKSKLFIKRPITKEVLRPATSPAMTGLMPWRKTIRCKSETCAPRAERMPNSRRRCSME